jgi:hypothetical protein
MSKAQGASSSLDDSWWVADGCFVTDILFKPGNKVTILFDDGREDGGLYVRMGPTVTLTLDRFTEDALSGRFIGNRFLRLEHRWRENLRAPMRTETCDFERMFESQT